MISTRQIYLMRLGRPIVPANFGGDSKSDSSTQTTSQVQNDAYSLDKRAVAQDSAVSLSGDGNTVTRNTDNSTVVNDASNRSTSTDNSTWLSDSSVRNTSNVTDNRTSVVDKSNRAVDNSTYFSDSSTRNTDNSTVMNDSSDRSSRTDNSTFFADSSTRDNSTHFTDSSTKDNSTYYSDSSNRSSTLMDMSNRSTSMVDNSNRSTSNTTTDYGSVAAALNGITTMTTKAFDLSGKAVDGAIGTLKQVSADRSNDMALAFDLAKGAGANALSNSAAVLGFASSALDKTSAAFAEAKDGGQSKMVMAALCVVGAIGVAFALKR